MSGFKFKLLASLCALSFGACGAVSETPSEKNDMPFVGSALAGSEWAAGMKGQHKK